MERLTLCTAIIILFTHNYYSLHVAAVESYPVRLTGGNNVYEGRVEVLYCVSSSSCTWRTVCTNFGWDSRGASVTCSQLGLYSRSSDINEPTASSSTGTIDSNAVSITCLSSAYSALGNCSVSSRASCGNYRRARVQCSSPPQSPSFSQPSFSTRPSLAISATVRWTIRTAGRSRPATKYEVKCSNDNYNSHVISATTTTLYSLQPCALYTCCVKGIDSNGAAGAVNCLSFRTPFSSMAVPGTPTILGNVQSQSIAVKWQPPSTRERCNPPILYSVRVEGPQQQLLCIGRQQMESSTTDTHAVIRGLCPYSSYRVSVKACTESVCGGYSSSRFVRTLEDAPTNVNNIMCCALSSTQVSITWQQPMQTNGVIRFYEVILNNINTTQNTTKYVESDTTVTTLSQLHPNHCYSCFVAAYTAAGKSISAVHNVILNQSSPTGVPEEFTCSPNIPTSLTLQLNWRQPNPLEQNGPIENYSVIVWNLDTDEVVYSNFTSYWVTSLTSTSLAPYHNYRCAVAANGRLGLGPFDERRVWISKTGHNFSSPSNIQVDHVTSHNFTVTWGEPIVRYGASICINGYHIEVFSDQENSTIFNHTYTQEDYSHNQESLHPNYRYEIQVSAIVAEMQGPIATHSVKTNEDIPTGAPENSSYFNVTSSTFTLTWNAPPFEEQNGDIIGYVVNVSRSDEQSHPNTITVKALSFTATSLSQDTIYEASVAAMTRVGVGPFSEPISIKTIKLAAVDAIAAPTLSVILVMVIFLLILVSLGLSWRIRNVKKTYEFPSELVQLQDHRLGNSRSNVIENAPPCIESKLRKRNAFTQKKIKPPAVPPKTYLEDTQGEIETPNDEETQSDDGDVDTCSVGSDSLYDMKLEKTDFKVPKRVASISVASEPAGATIIPRDKLPPRNVSRICAVSTDLPKQDQFLPEQVTSAAIEPVQAVITDRYEIPPRNVPRIRTISTDSKELKKQEHCQVHHKSECVSDSNESGYQKLDTKKLAPPNRYDDLENLSSKPQKDKALSKNRHPTSTRQERHYESLQLKSMDKESAYQELKSVRRS